MKYNRQYVSLLFRRMRHFFDFPVSRDLLRQAFDAGERQGRCQSYRRSLAIIFPHCPDCHVQLVSVDFTEGNGWACPKCFQMPDAQKRACSWKKIGHRMGYHDHRWGSLAHDIDGGWVSPSEDTLYDRTPDWHDYTTVQEEAVRER